MPCLRETEYAGMLLAHVGQRGTGNASVCLPLEEAEKIREKEVDEPYPRHWLHS